MTPKLAEGASLIASYGEGGFTISGKRHEGNLCVTPGNVSSWSGELTEDSFAALLEANPSTEILLIGTGTTHQFIPPAIRNGLKSRFGAGIEPMDTGGACRTFNILLSESRNVIAALIAI